MPYTYRLMRKADGTTKNVYAAAPVVEHSGLTVAQERLAELIPGFKPTDPDGWHVTSHFFGKPHEVVACLGEGEGVLQIVEAAIARGYHFLDKHRILAHYDSHRPVPVVSVECLANGAIGAVLAWGNPMLGLLEDIRLVHWGALVSLGFDPEEARRQLRTVPAWRFNQPRSKVFHVTLGYADGLPADADLGGMLPAGASVRLGMAQWHGLTRLDL